MIFLHSKTGIFILSLITIGTSLVITSVIIGEDADMGERGFQTVTVAVGTLVAFLVTTRISLASEQANTICKEAQAAVTAFRRLPKDIRKKFKGTFKKSSQIIIDGIETDDANDLHALMKLHVYDIDASVHNHADGNAVQLSYDAARTAYHRGSQIVFDQMLYSLIWFYYGALAPIAALNEFGSAARYIVPIVAIINYYVIFFAIKMEKPNLEFLRKKVE